MARPPWGTVLVSAAVGCGTWSAPGPVWWAGVPVPRAPHPSDLLRRGSAVPVAGPAARDADADGLGDTLLVDGAGGTSLWTDLDGDGFADRVTVLGGRTAPADDGPELPDLLGTVLQRLAGP